MTKPENTKEERRQSSAAQEMVDAPLIANFTHQIINPLNGVVGTIDNLIDGTINADRRPQRLRAVRGQLTYVIELVRNLAYLSQLTTETGRQSLYEPTLSARIPAVVIEAAMFFQELASEKKMSIDMEDRHTQYAVPGRSDLLRQVFTNLFENAIKYGDKHTKVQIVARPQQKTSQLLVEVINEGPGFGFDERDKIFERGYRGIDGKSVVASGSGIGLYLCKEILDAAFHAQIEAEHAAKLRRTIFRLRFPTFKVEEIDGRGAHHG